jgi:hypothetical protein
MSSYVDSVRTRIRTVESATRDAGPNNALKAIVDALKAVADALEYAESRPRK